LHVGLNEGLSGHVAKTPWRCQQTRCCGHAAKLKTVSDHHPTGSVLEVDLALPGFIRSTGTREYRWPMLWSWQLTDRSGDKSQRRDVTAERFASCVNVK